MLLDRVISYVPLAALIGAWLFSTAVGAVFIMLPGGLEALRSFLGHLDPAIPAIVGTPTYLALLFAPFVLWPVFGIAGVALGNRLLGWTGVPRTIALSSRLLWGMLLIAATYCALKLWHAGGLYPAPLLEGASYNEQMIERARLMTELRFTFYAVTYAVIPTICASFFARYLKDRTAGDLMGFVLTYLFYLYLIFVIYLKSPLLVVFIMLAVVALASRARLWWLLVLGVLSVSSFLAMQILIGGTAPTDIAAMPPQTQTPVDSSSSNRIESAVIATVRGVQLRMASAYPYYLAIFADETQRCGIESNSLPLLPEPSCQIPVKVFKAMYPQINWTVGYAPAAAHVSAYGEIGIGYSLLVMCLSGFSVGLFGATAAYGKGPFFAVLTAVTCVFAYYMTQVPLLGALTYSHGLIVFLLPLAVAGLAGRY